MITITRPPAPARGAMGYFATVYATWFSDVPLTGKTVRFNPGLFTNSDAPPTGADAYSVVYPAQEGAIDMNFLAGPIWKNGKAVLTALDAQTFSISLRFFYTTQIGYVSGAVPPGLPFTGGAVYGSGALPPEIPISGSPAYGSGSGTIAMHVSVAGQESTVLIPVTASNFSTAANVRLDYTSGIRVSVTTGLPAESVSYMGIYAATDFSRKGYAQMAANPIHVGDQDADAFIEGSPFVLSGGTSRASFSINPSWLIDGVDYYAYVVFRANGYWHSARSSVIRKGVGRPVIFGNVTYLFRDNLNNYTTGCLFDVPPCKVFSVSAKMDRASYDEALEAAGISGSQASRYSNVRATLQNAFTGVQSGQNLPVQVNVSDTGITALVSSYVPSPGVQYIVFAFSFYFADSLDTILVPMQVSTLASAELSAPEEVCFEQSTDLQITLPRPIGTAMVTQRDGNRPGVAAIGVSISGSTLLIDPSTIPLGVARCFDICSESAAEVQDCVCECECIQVFVGVYLSDVATGAYNYEVLVNYPVSAQNVETFSVDSTGAATQNQGGVSVLSGSGTGQLTGGTTTVYVSGEIALAGGCRYDIPLQTAQLSVGRTQFTQSIQICTANCDCDEVPDPDPECDNSVAITSECADSVLTFQQTENFSSPVSSDVTECSVDGGAYSSCADSYTDGETVTIRRRVSFTDGCESIESTLTANCEIVNNCTNSAVLAVAKTDTLLTLTLNGTYDSAPSGETIYYSLNGGLAYLTYSAPVVLEGGENIRAYSVTTFADGCPQVTTPVQSAGGLTVDNTEPLVTYCNDAGDVTGFAALIGSGSDIETIYFDTDMVQTLTVPLGGPCETFTPCATCP